MERRNFLRNIGTGSLAVGLSTFAAPFAFASEDKSPSIKELVPKHLSEGDTIGIISPASNKFESEPYEIAVESLQAMGLKVKLGKYVRSHYGHLAGTDEERAEDLNAMFKDPEVNAIIALRGGSGAARILDKIDYEAIAKNPKIFIGYSDITALHLAIYSKTGLVTFHGPMATSKWNSFSYGIFKDILFNQKALTFQNPSNTGDNLTQTNNRIRTIAPGTARGELVGGNLSVLTGIVGSKYLPDWENKILYLEEVGEQIYAIDRMMSQLQLAGILNKISGFVFGKCSDCEPGGSGYGSLTLEEVIDHYIKPLEIPAFTGAMFGHVDDNTTIPNGLKVEINAEKGIIKMLSPAVS